MHNYIAMFGSTYICGNNSFQLLKNNKIAERSRLREQHVQSILILTTVQQNQILMQPDQQ